MGNILSGVKNIELRKKFPKLRANTKLWIYSTLPDGCIKLTARVADVLIEHPDIIWEKHGVNTSIDEKEYRSYFGLSKTASALFLTDIRILTPVLSLKELREIIPGFQPPQSYQYLSDILKKSIDKICEERIVETPSAATRQKPDAYFLNKLVDT